MTARSDHTLRPAAVRARTWRYLLARRFFQLGILALFVGTARFGWSLFGQPLLSGDLSASLILGTIPMSDPFAVIQQIVAGHVPELTMIVGGLIVVALYALLGGRTFCAWVCPMNIVTDTAEWMRARLNVKTEMVRLSPKTRYGVAVGALIASVITGAAAFEWVSPQALLWREAIWGIGLGFVSAILGVFALDFGVIRRGWCGHLCPLGAFWSVIGRIGVVKPIFTADRCTRCGDCIRVCPEPQVLNLKRAAEHGMIRGGECTNCGRCIAICPENAFKFGLRTQATPNQTHFKQSGEPHA